MHLQIAFPSIKHTVRMPFVEKTKKRALSCKKRLLKTMISMHITVIAMMEQKKIARSVVKKQQYHLAILAHLNVYQTIMFILL